MFYICYIWTHKYYVFCMCFFFSVPCVLHFLQCMLIIFSGFTALCEKYSLDSRSASGTDKLSRTLNSYLSDIIDNIMGSEGDILKFAGELLTQYRKKSIF